jgi:hypothetical protein
MAGPERRVEDAFVEWCLKTHGLKARKLKDAGNNSWPDRTIILPGGRVACIEFKSYRGRLSPGQEKRIAELKTLGVRVLVTDGLEKAKQWLEQILLPPSSGPHTSTSTQQ